ncbi:hypothetical protein [Cytobacillus dafuensis]|uniref:Uncharacterized protein n=1 Tax=Cytobacillus dafuensis TaxID=1742359 RepID=A0A5B8Z9B4_CYTDA|nr:hypothetical protein [Cytobacillus dafuensis]QED49467.1 hypothetical protein FSZ17_20585 [Cytobacillus dafuensis]
MKKIVSLLTVLLLIVSLFSPPESAHAEKIIVKWGKITLKEGHIGKVIINKDTPLYKLDTKENKLTTVRTLKKGEEFGVYSKKTDETHGLLYGLGSSQFVKDSKSITYQTPSKEKKELVGKERIWLRNPDFFANNNGETVDLKNLQEAVLISEEQDTLLTTLNIKIKIGEKYFTNSYVGKDIDEIYLTTNPFKTYKFSDTIWNLIKNEKVQTGMTEDQVLLSWGYPNDVNSYDSEYIAMEQWIYGDILDGAAIYLYFNNGTVTSWQEF